MSHSYYKFNSLVEMIPKTERISLEYLCAKALINGYLSQKMSIKDIINSQHHDLFKIYIPKLIKVFDQYLTKHTGYNSIELTQRFIEKYKQKFCGSAIPGCQSIIIKWPYKKISIYDYIKHDQHIKPSIYESMAIKIHSINIKLGEVLRSHRGN